MNKTPILIAVAILLSICHVQAQAPFDHKPVYYRGAVPEDAKPDILALGIGFGQEYGGIGGNITVYPQKNIGLFVGGGTAFAGFGYNAGLKIRFFPGGDDAKVRPFITGMYGYNAAVMVSGASEYNKIWYGPTFGGGIDIPMARHKGYFTLALLVPIRSSGVHDYIADLQQMGVDIHQLIPITFSIGYKFVII